MAMTGERIAVEEVHRLHAFFEDWFAGRPGRRIEEFGDAIDEAFTIVGPDGGETPAAGIVDAVQGAFGTRTDTTIRVEEVVARRVGGVYLCRYVEVHETPGNVTRRVSTAVMAPDDAAPGQMRWLTVHETWLGA